MLFGVQKIGKQMISFILFYVLYRIAQHVDALHFTDRIYELFTETTIFFFINLS